MLSEATGDAGAPYPPLAMQAAARAGLLAAAVKAKLLADAEERNVLLLMRKASAAANSVDQCMMPAAA